MTHPHEWPEDVLPISLVQDLIGGLGTAYALATMVVPTVQAAAWLRMGVTLSPIQAGLLCGVMAVAMDDLMSASEAGDEEAMAATRDAAEAIESFAKLVVPHIVEKLRGGRPAAIPADEIERMHHELKGAE